MGFLPTDPTALVLIPAFAVSCAIARVAYDSIVRIGRLLSRKLENRLQGPEAIPPQNRRPES